MVLGFFTNTKNGNIGISEFPRENRKNHQQQILLPVGIELWLSAILVWCSPFCANLAFACKSKTLSSLYIYAPLVLIKSFKTKNQVVHEQKT